MVSKYVNDAYDDHYRHTKQLLLRLGLWPFQNWRQRLAPTLFLNFVILVIFVVEVCELSHPSFNIQSNVKEVQLFLYFLCCILCYYSTAFRRDTWRKLNTRIAVDWQEVSCEVEFAIMKKYADESRQFTVFIITIIHIFGIFVTTPPLLQIFLQIIHNKDDIKLTLPVPLKSIDFLREHIYVTLFIEIVAVWTIITIGIVLYTTFLLCIKHSCSLFRVITFKICQPFNNVSDGTSYDWFDNNNSNAYDWVKEIARRYQKATEYVAMLNSLTEKIYIIEVFVVILILVINFLILLQSYEMVQSTSMECIYQLVISTIYLSGSIVILYMNCYIGQTLMDHGTEVLQSFYKVPLYELPLKCQKVLPLMIMRSTKPSVISIGGMFVASHDFFARVMNTSISYAMVCYNMR